MRWNDIKKTPHNELLGLLLAHNEYERFHSMDGMTSQQVSDLAKENPDIRSQYVTYLETRRKYEDRVGMKKKLSFKGVE